MASIPDFDRLFSSGQYVRDSVRNAATIDVVEAGLLRLATGRLVARDPDYHVRDPADSRQAFLDTVEPGEYRMRVSLAVFEDESLGAAPAAVELIIADQVPVSWDLAICPAIPVPEDSVHRHGFAVDSGVGCYLDLNALGFLGALWNTESMEVAQERAATSPSGSGEIVDPVTGLNVIMFRCGGGDGIYSTWIGRDGRGGTVRFATAFNSVEPVV